MYKIPKSVKTAALKGITLLKEGFKGGTETGWFRAIQLSTETHIDEQTVRTMKAWFARHGPTARNGGTSYPGYVKWVNLGKPTSNVPKNSLRGAVAWLLWGGDPAYRWINALTNSYKFKLLL